ncbi:uncharacterized protein E0L32_011927 [Thyridium curvatum]|uniref:Lariat debranching enzyme C-terminal domain-containing protein n=1 Tax=Thyridium curvatum TaxID=1093900 RepID=A0A507BF95_9PEZI|nr:uncharacterized protein E0L32_011927 [Thyridium curvatum]TPX18016.1 hypothetical protein E0L32_011927 [Thyridium curvatum]
MESGTFTAQGVRVAVEGCGHGTLHAIYAAVEASSKARGWDGVDVLIIGGDFQAVRNPADLTVMSVPVKYRKLGDFHEYYSGARKAPYLTIFVAGNHEASSYLWELYYGGWVAPNIYYMGAANVLRLGPLRIAGMSGIWKGFDYRKTHHERLPFSQDDIKSFYHVREIDVRKLLQLKTQVDVGISHDWPRAVERHGDEGQLFRIKPFFKQESLDGTLGNPAAEYVMDRLRPAYWFSAHMHVKFSAVKKYDPPTAAPGPGDTAASTEPQPNEPSQVLPAPVADGQPNPDEIDLDLDDEDEEPATTAPDNSNKEDPAGAESSVEGVSAELLAQLPESFSKPPPQQQVRKPKMTPGQPVPPTITNTVTRFLALDKCEPGRHFLQLCEVPPLDPSNSEAHPPQSTTPRYRLQYDPEWLAITRVFAKDIVIGDRSAQSSPDLGEAHYAPLIERERQWVEEHVVAPGKLDVPDNFTITAPVHEAGQPEMVHHQPDEYTNPQTEAFCALVGVENVWAASEAERLERKKRGPPASHGRGLRSERDGDRRGGRGGGRGRGGRGWRGRAWRPASKPQQPKQCIVDRSTLTPNAGEAKIHVPSSARSHLGLRVNPMPRSDEAAAFFTAVYMAVQEIPHGKVTSYGHIAELIGTPQRPRQVGVCLKHLSEDPGARFNNSNVPWQRVINSKGVISPRSQPSGSLNQAAALRAEGVEVTAGALGELTVDFSEYGWFPRVLPSEAEEQGSSEEA